VPYRFFNYDEAAQYLNLTLSEVQRLVKDQDIPFQQRGQRAVFCRHELDAWASRRILRAAPERLAKYHRTSSQRAQAARAEVAFMPNLICAESVDPAVLAKTKPSLIREMVALAARTGWVCDPAELTASLEQREALGTTAVPGGVAFLHPRAQQLYRFEQSFLVLGRTVEPVFFGADDGEPTDLFFLLCCQDDKLHLLLLARLCLMAQETELLDQLRAASDAQEMTDSLLQAEAAVVAPLNLQ
jgi:excisionase family DNA binding protein